MLNLGLLIWFGVSFLGVAAGGRFFAHYYFQVLPGLCLIGARGLQVITRSSRARNQGWRRIALVLLIAGFIYTLVRSHRETVQLGADWIAGKRAAPTRLARVIAATVRDISDPADAADRAGAESIRDARPSSEPLNDPSDYLFVWGNWPEVYYWSGLRPASRYLSTQPLTGAPADVQYGSEGYRSILDSSQTAAARVELAQDLDQTPPKYIVDELGFRDNRLSIERYSELRELLSHYQRYGPAGGFPIYVRRAGDDNRQRGIQRGMRMGSGM